MKRIALILVISLLLCSCSNEQSESIEENTSIAALQRSVIEPPSHFGQLKKVESMKQDEVGETETFVEINDHKIKIPQSYTVTTVSWNNTNKVVLYSEQNDDTIDILTGTLLSAISSNEVADDLADWFIDTYYPEGQPKKVGNSVRSGVTIQNSITFTDGTVLTYLCMDTSIIVLLHKEESPLINDLISKLLTYQSDKSKKETVQELPSDYTALQGGFYYSCKNLIEEDGQTYLLFPLGASRVTLQVFSNSNELLYDTYLMKNSMYYTNSIKLKLKKSYVIYVSKTTAIAPMEEETDNDQSVSRNSE